LVINNNNNNNDNDNDNIKNNKG